MPKAEIWLIAGEKVPDHSTTARFRTGFPVDACEIFYQTVKRLEDAGELSKEMMFIDGTKLEVCGKVGRENVPEDSGCHTDPIVFVHGRGKRKIRNQHEKWKKPLKSQRNGGIIKVSQKSRRILKIKGFFLDLYIYRASLNHLI